MSLFRGGINAPGGTNDGVVDGTVDSGRSAGHLWPGSWEPPPPVPGVSGYSELTNYYNDLLPLFQQQVEQGISNAMSGAGLAGTRYGSGAQHAAARVGAEAGNAMQAQMSDRIMQMEQAAQDRALQKYIADQQLQAASMSGSSAGYAAERQFQLGQMELAYRAMMDQANMNYQGWYDWNMFNQGAHQQGLGGMMGLGGLGLDMYNAGNNAFQFGMQYPWQAALMQDQLQQNRLNSLFDWTQWEQGRQDQYGLLGYQDYVNNMYGLLPMLGGWAAAQGPGQVYQNVTNPGSPGWGNMLTGILGALGSWF